MTEETARLDYNKPPPGYEAIRLDGEEMYRRDGGRLVPLDGPYGAWAFYKRNNDPPGLSVVGTGDRDQSGDQRFFFLSSTDIVDNGHRRVEARAAAWTWHDRRHALAARLTLQDAWPRCLRWTESECDQVDRWIAGGEETPEAFWVQLKPASESEVLADDRQALALLEARHLKWRSRRHALAVDISEQLGEPAQAPDLLAKMLPWTDAECDEVERYAALPFPRSVDMPQVLQRVLLREAT